MYETFLEEVGLTKNESKTYLTLLKIGESTTSKIVNEAKISGGKIYETLDKLHEKELVSIKKINGVKHFQISNIKALINYIDDQKIQLEKKEKSLKQILPSLLKMQNSSESKASVNLLVGERSIKPLVKELFTTSKLVYAMGIRGTKEERYNNFWWHLTKEILEKKKDKAYYLFSENLSEYYKRHTKLKKVKVKYVNGLTPTAIDILDNNVLIFAYDQYLTCVHISNKKIADSFRSFFMSLWGIAKP